MYKKRNMSLLEIMIVILLIGIISSVVGFNVKGSLEKGKVFKTKRAQEQIRDLLLLEVAKGKDIYDVKNKPEYYLKKSGVVKDVDKFLTDGWGNKFTIDVIDGGSDLQIISESLQKYKDKKKNSSINTKDTDSSLDGKASNESK